MNSFYFVSPTQSRHSKARTRQSADAIQSGFAWPVTPKARLAFAKQRLATKGNWLLKSRWSLMKNTVARQRSAVLKMEQLQVLSSKLQAE
jgi:hypothetical protein